MGISKQQELQRIDTYLVYLSPKVYLCEYLSFLRCIDLVTPRCSNEKEKLGFLAAQQLRIRQVSTDSKTILLTPGHRL